MNVLWSRDRGTVGDVVDALDESPRPAYNTVLTMLRILERKGYVTHEVDGRTFIYRASDERQNVAVRAVKSIIDRFCGGSAEELVLGMVDNAVLNRKQLESLARKIAENEGRSVRTPDRRDIPE